VVPPATGVFVIVSGNTLASGLAGTDEDSDCDIGYLVLVRLV
jgi:hypothetical protein